jgi:asparagine synthase (glutamine-hydrolysing)
MLDAMRARGGDRGGELWSGDGAVLAVARHDWELDADFSGPVLVLHDDDLVVAADASVYYRDDLRRALRRRGIPIAGDTASHLVLAAYHAWGDDCAERIEGDFAFVVWNPKTRRVCAARDFSGKRTLYYAEAGDTLIIASMIGGVVAHPRCSSELNFTSLAETAGGLFAASHETCYRDVRSLPAGWTLSRRGSGRAELFRHWSPKIEERGDLSFEEGAEELRALLTRSVMERTVSGAPTSVWLSGGWDSPAVFGAGRAGARAEGKGRELLPVSMSYPPGDPGREDELIQAVADHWSVPVHWVDIRDVPFFDHPAERAALRDEPFAHPFELWHRSLARGSRAVGSRVALEGVGGDQLFQVSEVFLADLLRAGRWRELSHEWRDKGLRGTGFRNFFRWAVQPLLPAPALALARVLRRGRPLVGYLERRPPAWLDEGFVRRNRLLERERAFTPQRGRVTCVAYETEWYLTHPYFPRVFGLASSFALEEGVEIRSPLYDRRVIEFACTRPRWERSSGRETKRLLRAAVRGLLPAHVLAPRASRTGVTGGYFDRSMREHFPALLDEMLHESLLLRAGIIDAEGFRESCGEYLRGGGGQLGVNLFFTLQTELWLRARLPSTDVPVGATSTEPRVVVAR